jgi:hypothetical protein
MDEYDATPDLRAQSMPRLACASVHRPEIAALGIMSSTRQIAAELKKIAGGYGEVLSVSSLPDRGPEKTEQAEHSLFYIRFGRTADALLASQALQGLLCNFTTLLVAVPRNADYSTERRAAGSAN